METLLSVCVGIGLSAACGFRVFVPLLVMSIASMSGHLSLAQGFDWIGSYPALIVFSVATGLEIAGYYVPWVDHLLDTIASPAAVTAGIIVSASMVTDMSPMLKWTLAVVAGGGAAGLVQAGTVVARGASSASTAGFANPIIATVELSGAVLTSVLTLVAPLLAFAIILGLFILAGRTLYRRFHSPASATPQPGAPQTSSL
jgi:hypothetical protein